MIKRIICIVLLSLFVFPICVGATNDNEITHFTVSLGAKVTDGNVNTYVSAKSLTVTDVKGAKYLYLTFWDSPPIITVKVNGKEIKSENKFLQSFITLPETAANKIEIVFENETKLSEIRIFKDGKIPNDVHIWSPPVEKADLLLVATHSDDDQLFFAGLLPLYAGEKKYAVQVAYFIDHNENVVRRHELLNGLWTVGVTAYPVISNFPDEYSESSAAALNNFKKYGISKEDAIDWQRDLIVRFKPLVVVGHDLSGEYGHGQHILNAETLIRGIEKAEDIHKIQKLYLHLYNENKITMDYDVPLVAFGGKTAFEISKQGFECHKTQHPYWFYGWLNGKEKAAEITSYSPCEFGLYKTAVGADIKGGDMFENVMTYAELEVEQKPSVSEPEQILHDNEIKPKKDNTAYYILAAAVLTVIITVILIVICNKKR